MPSLDELQDLFRHARSSGVLYVLNELLVLPLPALTLERVRQMFRTTLTRLDLRISHSLVVVGGPKRPPQS